MGCVGVQQQCYQRAIVVHHHHYYCPSPLEVVGLVASQRLLEVMGQHHQHSVMVQVQCERLCQMKRAQKLLLKLLGQRAGRAGRAVRQPLELQMPLEVPEGLLLQLD